MFLVVVVVLLVWAVSRMGHYLVVDDPMVEADIIVVVMEYLKLAHFYLWERWQGFA